MNIIYYFAFKMSNVAPALIIDHKKDITIQVYTGSRG
jgi:hypothetical protein